MAWRNIFRHKKYAFVNIAGLAVGLTVFILAFLFVQHELSYDKFHTNHKNIYNIQQLKKTQNKEEIIPMTPPPLSVHIRKDFPEIKNTVRIITIGGTLFYGNTKKFYEDQGYYADASFFKIFNFRFLYGDIKTAMNHPDSIILTETLSKKYFSNQNPLGKTLRYFRKYDLKVTGVVKDPPTHSQFKFTYILPFSLLKKIDEEAVDSWKWEVCYTYLLMQSSHNAENFTAKVQDYLSQFRKDKTAQSSLFLMPLTKIHFQSESSYHISSDMPMAFILIFLFLGIFAVIIAGINFMNLSTAMSSIRSREVFVRKVVGSNQSSLVLQYLCESVLLAFISLVMAMFLTEIFLPEFKRLIGVEFGFQIIKNWQLFAQVMLITLGIGILSGSYPAFVLSSFKPINVLKGKLKFKSPKGTLRKVLVVSQFFIAIFIIIVSIIFYKQGIYMKNMDKGFKIEGILVQGLHDISDENIKKFPVFKDELLKHPHIIKAGFSLNLPHASYRQTTISRKSASESDKIWTTYTLADETFIDLYKIEILEGRNFSHLLSTDMENACLINETAARLLGWKNLKDGSDSPLDQPLVIQDRDLTIIGVVKDYHSTDLRLAIKPLAILPLKTERVNRGFYFSIQISPENTRETLAYVKNKFETFFPDEIYNFTSMEEVFAKTFVMYKNVAKLFGYASFLTIFIASLGLFALTSFTTERRTKEIGIRKVMGASVRDIWSLLSKEFAKILVISNAIAWPLAFFALDRGLLTQFHYRIQIPIWVFVFTGAITVAIALLTVSSHILRVARINPVELLRYE